MNRNVRRLLALAFLVVPLLVPAETVKAREGADRPEPGPEMVRALRRARRARIPRDQAETIRRLAALQGVVSVRGRVIIPLDGASLWELTNRGYAILGFEPTPLAMQIWTKDMGDGDIYLMACLCPNYDPNKDDGCKFDDPTNPTRPGKCSGNACCEVKEGGHFSRWNSHLPLSLLVARSRVGK